MKYAPDLFALVAIALVCGGVYLLWGLGWSLIAGGSLVYLTTILVVFHAPKPRHDSA